MQKSFFISFLILSLRWDLLSWVRLDHTAEQILMVNQHFLWRASSENFMKYSLIDITRIYTWDLSKSSVSLAQYSETGVWSHSCFHIGSVNVLPYSLSTSLSTIPLEVVRAAIWKNTCTFTTRPFVWHPSWSMHGKEMFKSENLTTFFYIKVIGIFWKAPGWVEYIPCKNLFLKSQILKATLCHMTTFCWPWSVCDKQRTLSDADITTKWSGTGGYKNNSISWAVKAAEVGHSGWRIW